jgi:5-methylcytosine-specific restriction endonuclease McrA
MSERPEPWEYLPEIWSTKAAYFTWLRGQMRRAWSRHPVKVQYQKSRRVRANVGKQRDKLTGVRKEVWALPCDICGGVFPQTEVEVDHIVRAGSFRNWEECEQWLRSLMQITPDDLQLACKPCHKIKSYAEHHGISFLEARAEKAAIEWQKECPPDTQKKVLLTLGVDAIDVSNAKKRRAAYVAVLLAKYGE